MALQLNRKLVVSIVGTAVALGLVVGLYVRYMRPRVQQWREANEEITKRKKRLEQLRKAFANQDDPKAELKTLKKEIENLTKINLALAKIKKAGVETKDLPKELKDPDPEIQIELYRDYIKEVMDVQEKKLKEDLKSARIAPPDIKLYGELDNAAEAAYYMNRAGGLRGIVDAMAKTQSEGNTIIFDKLILENYDKGKERRSGTGNVLSYQLDLTLNAQSLMAFLYNLREVDGYYFVEDMTLKPASRGRFGADGGRQLSVKARINTVLVYKSEAEKQIKATAAKVGTAKRARKGGPVGGLLALAMGMKRTAEEQAKRQQEKKWYEFWK